MRFTEKRMRHTCLAGTGHGKLTGRSLELGLPTGEWQSESNSQHLGAGSHCTFLEKSPTCFLSLVLDL